MPKRTLDRNRILTVQEVVQVIEHLKKPSVARSRSRRVDLAMFRLAATGGLRASECCGLRCGDVRQNAHGPYLRITRDIAKGGRPRNVPLGHDLESVIDLFGWLHERRRECLKSSQEFDTAPFLSKTVFHSQGERFAAPPLNARVKRIVRRVLGTARSEEITMHGLRHTCASHLLKDFSLVYVRDFLGHNNIATTDIYAHVTEESSSGIMYPVEPARAKRGPGRPRGSRDKQQRSRRR